MIPGIILIGRWRMMDMARIPGRCRTRLVSRGSSMCMIAANTAARWRVGGSGSSWTPTLRAAITGSHEGRKEGQSCCQAWVEKSVMVAMRLYEKSAWTWLFRMFEPAVINTAEWSKSSIGPE